MPSGQELHHSTGRKACKGNLSVTNQMAKHQLTVEVKP